MGSISKKALGKNDIYNFIFKLIIDILLSHLYYIFNTCLETKFCFTHFHLSIIIILCKLGKLNDIIAKTYCLIALFNILKKFLELILAKKITYLAKTSKLLSQNYFGANKNN